MVVCAPSDNLLISTVDLIHEKHALDKSYLANMDRICYLILKYIDSFVIFIRCYKSPELHTSLKFTRTSGTFITYKRLITASSDLQGLQLLFIVDLSS